MKTHVRSFVLLPLLVILFILPTTAGVIDSSAAGFTIRIAVTVKAPPVETYRQLTDSIGEWWNSDHTYSGNSRNMTITTGGGGCFCEKLDNGGIVRHMTVIYADPGTTLRLSGGLGPLQGMAVTGTMTWNLSPTAEGTSIEMTYTAGGYYPGGLNTLAVAVDMVLGEQIGRLKNYIDTGNPGGAGKGAK